MKLIYPAIFTPLSSNPSGYCVNVPDLTGCVPQWLNTAAEKDGINFSKVLQSA